MLSHHVIILSARFPQAFNKLGLLTPRDFSIGEAAEAQSAQGHRTRQHQGPELDSLERLRCKCGATHTAHSRCQGTSSRHRPTAPPRQGALWPSPCFRAPCLQRWTSHPMPGARSALVICLFPSCNTVSSKRALGSRFLCLTGL